MNGVQGSQKSESARNVNQHIGTGPKEKKCTKCGEEKLLTEFYREKRSPGGRCSQCNVCSKKESRAWRAANPEKVKKNNLKWRANNIEREREVHRAWRLANLEKTKKIARAWHVENYERVKELSKKWKTANPEKIKEIARRSQRKRRSTQRGRLSSIMSTGIRQSLKGGRKGGQHWEKLVGYTVEQLKKYIERQFTKGMTWEKLMMGDIHIDHKIPISAFNYKTPEDEDFKRCWALKNLQPMWADENIKKSNKLAKPFQPSLVFIQERGESEETAT